MQAPRGRCLRRVPDALFTDRDHDVEPQGHGLPHSSGLSSIGIHTLVKVGDFVISLD